MVLYPIEFGKMRTNKSVNMNYFESTLDELLRIGAQRRLPKGSRGEIEEISNMLVETKLAIF